MNDPYNTSLTWIKGTIGTVPPAFALIFHVDVWAAPLQWAFGCLIPCAMFVSLSFDNIKKWKDYKETKRQEEIKAQRREFFKRRKQYKSK